MDILAIGFGLVVSAMAGFWLFNSDRSPLWRAIDRRARRLGSADLAARFNGLVRFGLEGAYLGIHECRSGEALRFVKRMHGPTFVMEVFVDTTQPAPEIEGRIEAAIAPLGRRMRAVFVPRSEPGIAMRVEGEALGDPIALEGFASQVLRCLGHQIEAKYRIAFEGPSDHAAVDEYFGLSK